MARPAGRRALGLGLLALLVYNANGRCIGSGDSLPARFIPVVLWTEGSLYLDNVLDLVRRGHRESYWVLRTPDDRWASMYPVVTPLLVAPLYAPLAAAAGFGGLTPEALGRWAELMEKVAASVVAAATVALFYLLVRRRVADVSASFLTIVFAFATNTWTTASQALWQHGAGQLLLVIALLAVTRTPTPGSTVLAGCAAGLMVANRPPDMPLALAVAVFAVWWLADARARGRIWQFAGALLLPVAAAAAYNLRVFGRWLGGYAVAGVADPTFFDAPVLEGIAGLLVSPGKGLFLWAPFLLLALAFPRRCLGVGLDRALAICLAGGFLAQVLLYAGTDWRAGNSYGPRFLTDVLPALIWLLAPAVPALGRGLRIVLLAAVTFSILVQAVGAFRYQGVSDIVLYADDRNVWRFDKTPYVLEARQPFARMNLLTTVLGLAEADTYPGNWLRSIIGDPS